MNKQLLTTIQQLKNISISEERKTILKGLVSAIQSKIDAKESINLNFICTHNSRRSHLGQIWMQTLAHHFNVPNVFSYSGGTEGTAIAKPILKAIQDQGFTVDCIAETDNSVYAIKYNEKSHPIIGFSKDYAHPFNPKTGFIAVMVCSQADEGCPFVAGAEKRVSVTYEDPKLFDNTDLQDEKYVERSTQIASELYYAISQLKF